MKKILVIPRFKQNKPKTDWDKTSRRWYSFDVTCREDVDINNLVKDAIYRVTGGIAEIINIEPKVGMYYTLGGNYLYKINNKNHVKFLGVLQIGGELLNHRLVCSISQLKEDGMQPFWLQKGDEIPTYNGLAKFEECFNSLGQGKVIFGFDIAGTSTGFSYEEVLKLENIEIRD